MFGAEHGAELVVQELGLFSGVGDEFPCIFEWGDTYPLGSSCLDEAPELLLGGGWVLRVISDQPFYMSPIETAQTFLDESLQ